jgi:hypothetical protein
MRKKFFHLAVCLFFCFICAEGSSSVFSDEEPAAVSNLIIILDCSKSMCERTKDGEEKLASAKDTLNGLLDELPEGLNTGMIAYGHSRGGDCGDIELVFPCEALNKDAVGQMKSVIQDFKPLGMTPIAGSLEMAGGTLRGINGDSGIILISDGVETCGGDPVTVAGEIGRRYHIKVYVDVIGFDVYPAEQRQLEAIARAGGGRYYNASTASELKLAAKKAIEERKVIAPPKEVIPEPAPIPKKEAPYLDRGEIDRGGQPVRGGKYYDDAVEIQPGKYHIDHKLRENEYDYFKIKVKSGQRLNCSILTTDISQYAGLQIHSFDRKSISSIRTMNYNQLKTTFAEFFDLQQETEDVYVVVGSDITKVGEDVVYEISLQDHFDADSPADAGNVFDKALEITRGKYETNWLPLNDVDMYKVSLKKDEELSIKIIPDNCPRRFCLSVTNEDRETLAKAENKEDGSVVKATLANQDGDQKVCIKIDHGRWDDIGQKADEGKYIMQVDVKKLSE